MLTPRVLHAGRAPMRRPRRMRRSRAGGAGMVEVLVALTITSVGLLSLAASHLSALRMAKLSQYRAVAALLVNDFAERMRANAVNPAAVANYAYTVPYDGQAATPSPPSKSCTGASGAACSVAEMAQEDLYLWRRTAKALLPQGAVYALPDPLAAGAVDLWVAWSDPVVANPDEIVRTQGSRECPLGLSAASRPSVRCLFMRVQL